VEKKKSYIPVEKGCESRVETLACALLLILFTMEIDMAKSFLGLERWLLLKSLPMRSRF